MTAHFEDIRTLRAEGLSYSEIATKLNLHPNTVYKNMVRMKRQALAGHLGTKPVLPGFVLKQTSAELDGDGEVAKQWVQQVRESGEVFSLPAGHVVKGMSTLVDPDHRVLAQWIKTRTDVATPDLIQALRATFDEYRGRAEPAPAPKSTDADLLSVYPIADQHHGMLAWGRETGDSYDLKIGAERLKTCLARLVAQAPPSRQAIIVNLGDYQHTDDGTNMTPRSGHVLDVDSRYFKILQTGVRLMMDCIDLALQKHETVLVRNIPGNHDPHASIALTVALGAFYANDARVTIDDDPSDFFYHRFGQTLIGAVHGHKLKPDRMAMDMAVTHREDWGATRYHWFLFGHIHRETVTEIGDVRVESFRTLASKDAHAASSGYTSGQSLSSVTLHVEDGEIGRHRVNIPPPQKRLIVA